MNPGRISQANPGNYSIQNAAMVNYINQARNMQLGIANNNFSFGGGNSLNNSINNSFLASLPDRNDSFNMAGRDTRLNYQFDRGNAFTFQGANFSFDDNASLRSLVDDLNGGYDMVNGIPIQHNRPIGFVNTGQRNTSGTTMQMMQALDDIQQNRTQNMDLTLMGNRTQYMDMTLPNNRTQNMDLTLMDNRTQNMDLTLLGNRTQLMDLTLMGQQPQSQPQPDPQQSNRRIFDTYRVPDIRLNESSIINNSLNDTQSKITDSFRVTKNRDNDELERELTLLQVEHIRNRIKPTPGIWEWGLNGPNKKKDFSDLLNYQSLTKEYEKAYKQYREYSSARNNILNKYKNKS